MENSVAPLKELLTPEHSPKIVITTHHKPDADALGSSLGLYHYFRKKGLKATVISPTDYGAFLHWMPGNETVIDFEEKPELSKQHVLTADYVFCLDFNALKRVNDLGAVIEESMAKKVMIDHHLEPGDFADYKLWSTEASSTCELIYKFIEEMGDAEMMDQTIAQCLYAGIMTDTGSFRFSSCTAQTHRVIAELLDTGMKNHVVHSNIFDQYSESRTRMLGYVLYNKMQVLKEYNTALVALSREDLKLFNVSTGDTEGFVNFGLSIKGIKLSVLIIDRTKLIKMSFRSKGDFPANEFARRFFNGGGHFNAAGGESTTTLEETVERFKQHLKEYKEILNNSQYS